MSSAPISTEELWELFGAELKGFLARRVRDPQAVEDLLQETFVRVHVGLGGLGDEQRIKPWIFQIARNLVVDYRRARTEPASDADLSGEIAAHHAPADAENWNAVVRDWLPAMIDQLPASYQQAVRLFELEGVPQQEIAERLGISLSGAKSRVQRGRDRLRKLLFDCCFFERDRRGNVIGVQRNRGAECDACE